MRLRKSLIEAYPEYLLSPGRVQKFVRSLEYNDERNGETLRSAEEALRAKTLHCLEASLVAAALLERKGYPPLLLSLESVDELDHVLYLFRWRGRWGTIGRSRDEGLNGRRAIFRSPFELAKSYRDPYVDATGRIKAYAVIHLGDYSGNWRYSKRNLWSLEQFISEYPHKKLNFSDGRYKMLRDRYMSNRPIKKHSSWI